LSKTKVLILGVTGMLGHTLFTDMLNNSRLDVIGTVRNKMAVNWFTDEQKDRIRDGVDANRFESIRNAIVEVKPDVVINCIGLIKQLDASKDPVQAIGINALLPHLIAQELKDTHTRFIHISTDCVFNGGKGLYIERDSLDAEDLYGQSKFLGEVHEAHTVTLRTSIIGHELKGKRSLIEWFLAQSDTIRGYSKAIYSGFPTIELSRIMQEYVIPNLDMSGLFHVSTNPISKYALLKLVAETYGKEITIIDDDQVIVDRSLDSCKFRTLTGYSPPNWQQLVKGMHDHYLRSSFYNKGDYSFVF